jgi:hypothetical protein
MPKYKYGKIERTIDREILAKLMKRVKVVDRCGYSVEFIQALLALYYWGCFRVSEVIGAIPHKYTRHPKGKLAYVCYTERYPPIVKEKMWLGEYKGEPCLFVKQGGVNPRKHGHREGPLAIPIACDYVNFVVERWKATEPGKAVFPINSVTWWRILKRIDPKLYTHFFELNRLTKQAEDPTISMKDQEDWSGKTPVTIAKYRALAGRNTAPIGLKMLEEK